MKENLAELQGEIDKSTIKVGMILYSRLIDNHISAGLIIPILYDEVPYTYIS